MRTLSRRHSLRPLILVASLCCACAASAAEPPRLPAALQDKLGSSAGGLLRLIVKLSRQQPPQESDAKPPESAGDPLLPAIALPDIVRLIDEALAKTATPVVPALQSARAAFIDARAKLQAGSSDSSPSHLIWMLQSMTQGQASLEQAINIAAQVDPAALPLLLAPVQRAQASTARQTTLTVGLASAAGANPGTLAAAQQLAARADAAHAAGQYAVAIGLYNDALGLAAATVVFDKDRFVQNLRSVFDNQTVGAGFTVTFGGSLVAAVPSGSARTAADPPAAAQSTTRKMHVASVSKTLTAIVTLRVLADLGLTPDEPIGAWLPSHWVRGAGVNALRFRDLMTHRSGFEQNAVEGSSWPYLQAVIAKDVGSRGFAYNNANFGMLRILVAGLMGIDAAQFGEFDGGVLTAAAFLLRAQGLYGGIGVPYTCDPAPFGQTLEYLFPDTGGKGFAEEPMSLACGGFGAFMSAQDLARTLVALRYTSNLLAPADFSTMKQGYLGFLEPARYGFGAGVFGEYPTHGGDWDHGSGGLDSCVMLFPIQVEAAVVINSSGSGYTPVSYQCSVLKWAFENAWVAP